MRRRPAAAGQNARCARPQCPTRPPARVRPQCPHALRTCAVATYVFCSPLYVRTLCVETQCSIHFDFIGRMVLCTVQLRHFNCCFRSRIFLRSKSRLFLSSFIRSRASIASDVFFFCPVTLLLVFRCSVGFLYRTLAALFGSMRCFGCGLHSIFDFVSLVMLRVAVSEESFSIAEVIVFNWITNCYGRRPFILVDPCTMCF